MIRGTATTAISADVRYTIRNGTNTPTILWPAEDQDVLPGQNLQNLVQLKALRFDLCFDFRHGHLMLRPDRNLRILLPVFQQNETSIRL